VLQTRPPLSAELSLQEVLRRLARHDAVDGLLVMGSGGHQALSPVSDYDVLIVHGELPAPLFLAVTTVEERFAEFYFVPAALVDSVNAAADLSTLVRQEPRLFGGTTLRWIAGGRIVFDRAGRLERARERIHGADWGNAPDAEERYLAWFQINYNLRQTLRMAHTADPVYLTAVDLRLLYCAHQLWTTYFLLRSLQSGGEKADIRYLDQRDPGYLDRFRRFLAEADRSRKLALYRELAAATLEPVGGLWSGDVTAVQLDPGSRVEPQVIRQALDVWDGLVSDEGGAWKGNKR
jgi:hypothetical protein